MIKFTGLILICAASALALLLPALGVVKFPMVPGTVAPGTVVPGISQVTETNSALPPTIPQSLPPGLMTGTNLAGNPTAGTDPAGTGSGPFLFGPPWTKQKLGLNVWLLLGPVLVIGLAMWTFAPNRGGLGR